MVPGELQGRVALVTGAGHGDLLDPADSAAVLLANLSGAATGEIWDVTRPRG